MQQIQIVTAQNVTLRIELANIGDRFVAAIIDFMIKWGVLIGIVMLIEPMRKALPYYTVRYITFTLMIIDLMFYSLLFEFFMKGQSPGKLIMKIRVARLDGEAVSIGNLLLRWLFRIIDFPIAFPTVGICAIVMNEKNQRLGDIVAGTVLVSSKSRSKLEDTFYKEVETGYVPTFTRADQLSTREAEIINQVLQMYEKHDKYELIPELAGRIKTVLQVQPNMDDLTFLRTVITDYNNSGAAAKNDMGLTATAFA